jgi:hypothetical protein
MAMQPGHPPQYDFFINATLLNLCCMKILAMTCFLLTACYASVSGQVSSFDSLGRSARIGGRDGGVITRQELISSGRLTITVPYDTLHRISSFRLTRVRTGTAPVELINAHDGGLTEEMKELIRAAVHGDKIYFEYIKCRANDESIRSLHALVFTVE